MFSPSQVFMVFMVTSEHSWALSSEITLCRLNRSYGILGMEPSQLYARQLCYWLCYHFNPMVFILEFFHGWIIQISTTFTVFCEDMDGKFGLWLLRAYAKLWTPLPNKYSLQKPIFFHLCSWWCLNSLFLWTP